MRDWFALALADPTEHANYRGIGTTIEHNRRVAARTEIADNDEIPHGRVVESAEIRPEFGALLGLVPDRKQVVVQVDASDVGIEAPYYVRWDSLVDVCIWGASEPLRNEREQQRREDGALHDTNRKR